MTAIDVVTIFPAMIDAVLSEGVVGRARSKGVVDVKARDLRDYTSDKHRVVDDMPFGGGPGMVLKPEPLFRAVEEIAAERGAADAVVLMTPQGRPLSHAEALRFSRMSRIVVLCGRYEGVDERVAETLVTDEISIGDYVVTGGELPALVLVDAVVRLIPGVVGDEASVEQDSFVSGLLDHPHYTRPAVFRGLAVPDVLSSGHHGAIEEWRAGQRLARTKARRPDLLKNEDLLKKFEESVKEHSS
ncbi:MAG: tRNA (guanosine(37)-N1)-methyltransferase TrmD [Acidobacteria bacterium]|jgi:tRNA (guanine37-N1)-methyltransferase|nr:tRNA (guanosine(37)-N1)-methyltransferase TrmD [Acidobacteriota bacterium]